MLPLPDSRAAKGHGTGNDFILLADPDGRLDVTAEAVASWCERSHGIGADGVIRAVLTENLVEAADLRAAHPRARWFMDYRNADGSIAQMCGNGIRVFVEYLRALGLIELAVGEVVEVGTRAGALTVRREKAGYAVDLGAWTVPGGAGALADGFDAMVQVRGLAQPRPGLRLRMPNPHVVVALTDPAELAALDLTAAPLVEPAEEEGTNVEFVVALGEDHGESSGEHHHGDDAVGVIQMRVHERGVGETLSCGTGAAAAAMAVRAWAGAAAPQEWTVFVPGGRLRVRALPIGHAELAGPAEIVAHLRPAGSTSTS